MEFIDHNDLVVGEIYNYESRILFEYKGMQGSSMQMAGVLFTKNDLSWQEKGTTSQTTRVITATSPEEKHWQRVCWEARTTVSKEKAMETFKVLTPRKRILLLA